jgi:hypothetical protein
VPFGFGRREPPPSPLLASFRETFEPDASPARQATWTGGDTKGLVGLEAAPFTEFMSGPVPQSVANGLLRFLTPDSHPSLTGWNGPTGWRSAWPSLPAAAAFATDWFGRVYMLATDTTKGGQPRVARLDPSSGQREVFDATFDEFLGDALPRVWERMLSTDLRDQWLASGGRMPAFAECVSPKVSLQLGGRDDASNWELAPIEVYVSIEGQIYEQIKRLPPGTKISGVATT